jgi:hypothetical protein
MADEPTGAAGAPDPGAGTPPDPTQTASTGSEPTSGAAAASSPSTSAPGGGTGEAPWSSSLAQAFPDESVRGQVDQYLRSTVQPYITQREQDTAPWNAIWNEEDPETALNTYLAVAEARFGPEFAQAVLKGLEPMFQDGDQGTEGAPVEGTDTGAPEFEEWLALQPPEVQQFWQQQMEQQEDQHYEEQLARAVRAEPSIKGLENIFSRYVVSSQFDDDRAIDEAVQMWQAEGWPQRVQEHPELFGLQTAPEGTQAAAAEPGGAAALSQSSAAAPTVLGAGTAAGGGGVGAEVPQSDSLDSAVDLFFRDLNSARSSGTGL